MGAAIVFSLVLCSLIAQLNLPRLTQFAPLSAAGAILLMLQITRLLLKQTQWNWITAYGFMGICAAFFSGFCLYRVSNHLSQPAILWMLIALFCWGIGLNSLLNLLEEVSSRK